MVDFEEKSLNDTLNLTYLKTANEYDVSIFYLQKLRPAFFGWILVCIFNLFIAIWLLVVFKRWKIYDGDMMFILRWVNWQFYVSVNLFKYHYKVTDATW